MIKRNSGLPVEGQINLVDEIETALNDYYPLLNWKTIPSFKQFEATIELCWRFLLKPKESRANIRTPRQLAFMTYQYYEGKSLQYIIASSIESSYWKKIEPNKELRIQKVVHHVLGVARQWFDFKLPKLLAGISELQDYVFRKYNKRPGNYTYFSALIENSFFSSALSVLMDYDVPSSALRKLEKYFKEDEDWQTIENKLRVLDFEAINLLPYEVNKLKAAIK